MTGLFSNRLFFALRIALVCWLGMACICMPMLHTHAHHAPLKFHLHSAKAHPDKRSRSLLSASFAGDASTGSHFCFACHWLKNLSKVVLVLPPLLWACLIVLGTCQYISSPAASSRILAIDARAPPSV